MGGRSGWRDRGEVRLHDRRHQLRKEKGFLSTGKLLTSSKQKSIESGNRSFLKIKQEENETLPQYDHRGMEIDLQAHELDLLDGLRGNRREASMEALKLKQMHLTTLRKLMQG